MSPSPKQAPRLGDIPGPADLARRVDRYDALEIRMGRVEQKLDRLLEIVLDLRPKSIAKR